MFWFRDTHASGEGGVRVDVAFTDAELDLQGLRPGFPDDLARLEAEAGVGFARLSQVHGADVVEVEAPMPVGPTPEGDALLTTRRGVGLMIRVADCVPVVLADPGAGVASVVHAGRPGMVRDVVGAALVAMRERGAGEVLAWLGPHVCGACYEVPAALREEVCAVVPEAWAETSWGTPSVDIGAGVRAQLERGGARVVDVPGCTREEHRLHSYRRDGTASGRLGGLVWLS